MHHLTPLTIRRQEFKKNLRGYDVDEVNAFLEIIANSFEELLHKTEEQSIQINELNRKLQDYQQIEKGLQQTLLNAQEQTSKSVEASKRQATLIIKEAEISSKQMLDSTKAEAKKIQDSVANLRTERETLIQRLRAVVNAQMQLLDSLTIGERLTTIDPFEPTQKEKIDNIIGKLT